MGPKRVPDYPHHRAHNLALLLATNAWRFAQPQVQGTHNNLFCKDCPHEHRDMGLQSVLDYLPRLTSNLTKVVST